MISVRLRDPITWSWSCELFFKFLGSCNIFGTDEAMHFKFDVWIDIEEY